MDDEKLIAAVRSRPCLYNKNDRNHYNRNIIATQWGKVAEEVGHGVTPAKCKSRWISIRDYFLKIYKESQDTTSGQAAKKKIKWYLYNFLLFLEPPWSSGSSSGHIAAGPGKGDNAREAWDEDEDRWQQDNLASSDSEDSSFSVKKPPSHQTSQAKSDELSAVDVEVLKALRAEGKKEVDQNELFFQSLLPSLKCLDAIQSMEFRLQVQQLALTYIKEAHAKTGGHRPTASPTQCGPPQHTHTRRSAAERDTVYQSNDVSQTANCY